MSVMPLVGWTAAHDHMPGKLETLRIDGSIQLSTPGYTNVGIRPRSPQGINPDDYLFEYTYDEPTTPQAEVITTYEIHYEEQTETCYKTVSVTPEGPLNVEVQEVQ